MPGPALLWFRQDLRLADNPALEAARKSGAPLAFLYVLDDETPGAWRMGAASRWWLHESLAALAADLEARGARLILRRGRAEDVLPRVVDELGAEAVFWNRAYEPYAVKRDAALKERLANAKSFNGALLREPWELKTKSGEPYKVFTPFWRALAAMGAPRAPLPAPAKLTAHAKPIASDALEDWALRPTKPNWAARFPDHWSPGEAGARAALKRFTSRRLAAYAKARDIPAADATSRLSPHLRFGEISPVQIWAAVEGRAGAEKFLSEIAWREFSAHLLFHAPNLPEKNWRSAFDAFPWRADRKTFAAWTRGQTGYPIVDAGMRELWATGYMHNRVRMIAASFLIKHLLIDWRRGERWFWDTLVDADLANNAASWQWVAGSGADAAPYFRIFNPVLQGERYDPAGAYVRRWVPELAQLPAKHIHQPWRAPAEALGALRLGRDYPSPIVDHAEARARALAAYESLRSD